MAPAPIPVGEAEGRLVRALVEDPSVRRRLLGEILPADLEGSAVSTIVKRILDLENGGAELDYPTLSAAVPDRDRAVLARIGMRAEPVPGEREAMHCLESLRRARLVRERVAIQKELEKTSEPARVAELMRRKIDLSRQIDAMS